MAKEYLAYRQIPKAHTSPLSSWEESRCLMAHRTDPTAKVIYNEYGLAIKKAEGKMKTGTVIFIGSAITMGTAIFAHKTSLDPDLVQRLITGSFYGSLIAFGVGAHMSVTAADQLDSTVSERNRQLDYPRK